VNSLSTRAWKVPAAECNPNGMRLNFNSSASCYRKGRQGPAILLQGDLPVRASNVQARQILCVPQVIKYMGDVGERITHPLKPGVHSAEVDNKPVRTVLLRHHEIRRVLLRLGPLNDILPQHFVDLLVDEALNKGADAVASRP
jgi:hypothetical protein